MKLIKGVMIGTLISAGVVMMYNEGMNLSKKGIMKKGKKIAKKMGMM